MPQVLTAGTYYVLAHSVSGAAAGASYTLTATDVGHYLHVIVCPFANRALWPDVSSARCSTSVTAG